MAPQNVLLTIGEYEALMPWAKLGAGTFGPNHADTLLAMRRLIDQRNGINRYTLLVRFDPLPQLPAPGITDAPKGKTQVLELLRPPTAEDVLQALEGESFHMSMVWVTADPTGTVGWYDLEHYPWS